MPNAFAILDVFPLLPTGKIDRNALPQPERVAPPRLTPPVRARDDMERALIAIWQDVLSLPTIGVDDNFFDLGGTSLQLIEVQEQLRGRLSRTLDIVELFRHPRISMIANHLSGGNSAASKVSSIQQRALLQGAAIAEMRRRSQSGESRPTRRR
jgi:aryl carrier-like protein